MRNLQDYYESKGWSAGPHLFTDDDQVWTFSPMTARGVHAVSFNSTGIGIEMIGDYDTEDPWTGRGLQVLTTTCLAVKAILARLQLTPAAIRFHRDDPRATKTCPGKKITKEAFLAHLAKT
jgi:N-acetyl-anhydromuramyl-L-alanine amidase AmpD